MFNITSTKLAFFHERLMDWYVSNKRIYPWRTTSDPYLILISEVLLQQTDASKVEKVFDEIITICPGINELHSADEEKLMAIFKKLGLFRRALVLKNIAKKVISEYDGKIPNNKKALMEFNGVGDYIANALLCFAFEEPVAIVDTNIIRIIERVFAVKSDHKKPRTDKIIHEVADFILLKEKPRSYNYALLDFAGKICKARNPICDNCTFYLICQKH